MKSITLAAALLLATSTAFAATQQEKMRTCSAEAKAQSLKGDERRAFMSQCLSVSPEEKQARLALREKTRSCAAEAKSKSLKGEDRKTYISQCVGA